MHKLPTKVFSSFRRPAINQPNLVEIQIASYQWFLKTGLRELFAEVSPIKDYAGKDIELHFLDYSFDEPKHNEEYARFKDLTYEAALRVKAKLINRKMNDVREQEVYFGDFPVMTDRGTFIVNGVERVVVSQLIRSSGVYFTANVWRSKQLFGAKIIPNRGAWLEFETDADGFLGVRIDRHRKAPVTNLLRIFGLAADDDIRKAFADIDTGPLKYLEATLKKDDAKTIDQSYLEIYKRYRPGDLATAANAKSLIDGIFRRADRYDLSVVGRFKLNQRLNSAATDSRLIELNDLIAVIREIIRLNNEPQAEPDDIDHLGNRRVRPVGELLQQKMRVGLARQRRQVQDRMSTLDIKTLTPVQLINAKPLVSVIKEFFSSSQLSQFMDQVNPLAEVEHKRRISAMGPGGLTQKRAGFEVRDVHRSHYGRICPIQTPEGQNIGLVNHLASYARLSNLGFLEAPYLAVKNGKVTNTVVWLNALEEEKCRIAHAGVPLEELGPNDAVEGRVNGEPGTCLKKEVDYLDVSPQQFISLATSLIPFLEHDDANRALMGSNMQRQAVVSVRPDAPYVGTGVEEKAARDSGHVLVADVEGEVTEVDARTITVKTKTGNRRYILNKFKRSNQFTCISQRPLVQKGDRVTPGTLLADGPSIDHGVLALGQNLVVAFMSWGGANFEDAIIISERVVEQDRFTSIHIVDFECDVRDTKLGPELTTPDIPNVSEEKLKNLDEDGLIRVGAEVRSGDILVGKISPKGESELTAEERLLRAIFGEKARDVKDSSLTMPHGKYGRVVGIKVFARERGDKLEPGIIKKIQVEVAQLRTVRAGDKLAGRHGNKGVISQVRPVADMPYLADGTPVDIILNPLGVASRMNLGQILETHLGWAAKNLGYRAITPALAGATESEIKIELRRAGLPENGKTTLYDGATGTPFLQPVTVGVMYMMKLNHLVEDKIHMRSTGPYSLITQQPLGGKAHFGGQRFGEMEVWALEGYGAAHTLQEMLTIKSDDVLGRSSAYESIIKGEQIKKPNIPASFNVLISELKALGIGVELIKRPELRHTTSDLEGIRLKIAAPEDILQWSHGEVIKPETINYRTQRPEKDGLFSERIFGPTKDWECYCGKYRRIRYKGVICDKCGVEVTRAVVRRERMGHIKLAVPVTHIWFLRSIPSKISLLLDLPLQRVEKVVYYISYIITAVNEENRTRALEEIRREFRSRRKTAEQEGVNAETLKEATAETEALLSQLRVGQIISETEFHSLARRFGDVFEAGTGAEALRTILERIDFVVEIAAIKKDLSQVKDPTKEVRLLRRLKLITAMAKNNLRSEWMIMTVLPVLPPDLRPMVALDGGRYATSDLNDLYRRVINRNNRLKKLIELNAPEIITINEKRMLQEAVDALFDNSARFGTQQLSSQRRPLRSLADYLKGKQGRFRQNLLGKRVDYSARSVIVVGPELKLHQCGLPKKMALEIFKPFVINKIIERGLAHNIRHANRLIDQALPDVWAILEEVIAERTVLLNRAPTLHRLGIQAFQPLLIEDFAIRIPPLVCMAFNADFDGDQMAVHLPLTEEAQREGREIMLSNKNVLKPATGDPIVVPTQDVVLGCYFLTQERAGARGEGKIFSGAVEARLAYEHGFIELGARIRIGARQTTVGRLFFNEALPEGVEYVNANLNKNGLGKLIAQVVNRYGIDRTAEILDSIKNIGFAFATLSGISWGMDDLIIPHQKESIIAAGNTAEAMIRRQYEEGLLTAPERRARVIEVWTKAKASIEQVVKKETLDPHGPIYSIIDSGSRGSWSQPIQMMGMKGLVVNPKNEIIELPVKTSLKEGHTVLEYFISTHGARKGTTDTALKTAHAGYLARRLIDVCQDLVIREDDCRTKEGIDIFRQDGAAFGQTLASRVFSRTALEDVVVGGTVIVPAGDIIDRHHADAIDAAPLTAVKVRSPITCKTLYGVCSRCYGFDLGKNELIKIGEAVGVVAAQSISEPGTQLTMRTFHTGGVAGADITHGLPRVEELFEARLPKGKAFLAEEGGVIESIEERGLLKLVKVKSRLRGKTRNFEYPVPRFSEVYFSAGDAIEKGDQLSEGHIDLREIFKLKGARAAERYLLSEVQKIYVSEGASINNKHIEVIIRQMFSRVRIKEPGVSEFVTGDIVEKSRFLEVNRVIKKTGGEPAKAIQLFMGITKVALSSESFLSAASFMETAKVLINAASEGRFDMLRGLKENVIIGRLIPVGTGFGVQPEAAAETAEPVAVANETAVEG